MADWLNDFDDQCRSEGLEVPKKNEEIIHQPSSEITMEQNEENRGFNAGIGRGGAFGSGKPMNAPPPQTSFGSTSGTRMGGSFGNAQTADARGTPLGSSEEGGGNIISVGIHRDKPACTLTKGGGFGTNRSMLSSAPTTVKNNYEGGRFGAMSPRSFGGPSEEKKTTVGGRFGSSFAGASASSATNENLGSVNNSGSCSRASVGGAFGARTEVCEAKVGTVGGGFGCSRASSARLSGPTNTSNSTSIGGSFGYKPEETSSSTGEASNTQVSALTKPVSSFGGAFGSKDSSESKPTSMGGAFGSRTSLGGAFGSARSSAMGGSFSKKPENVAAPEYSTPPPTINTFSATPNSDAPRAFGSFGGKLSSHPEEEGKSSFYNGTASTQERKVHGGFGMKADDLTETKVKPKVTFGGGFSTSTSNSKGSFGGSFGTNGPTNKTSFGGGFCSKPAASENSGATFPSSASGGCLGGSFGNSDTKLNIGNGLRSDSDTPSKPMFGAGFASAGSSGNFNSSGTSENKKLFESGFGFVSKENENPFPADPTLPKGGFGMSHGKPTFNIRGSNRQGFNGSRSNEEKTENDAPFMPGPPTRGGFRGGFRGGRGAGGHMDYAAGQGHGMGRGQGQQNQQFVPQQRSTPPPFQNVVPDSKYKYTKPAEETHEKVPVPADIALLNKFIQKEVKMMKDMVVDVQRQDPKSPLYSISSFRELRLKPEVLQALDQLNFQFPTRIQETALPLLLMEPPSNLIAQAQSGTGKTAAFVLTMLCRIDVNLKCPQCICLAPTLELAKQIGEVVEKMGRYMENLKIHYAIKGGNMAAMRGRKLTEQIVIGTPGITRDYLQKYKCIDPAMIRCLVLDEADVMIYHQGFTDISTTIYNMVEEASDSVQSMLFSATYDEPVINFATKIIKNAIVVMLKREEQALPNIKQFYVQCACRDSKYAAIVNLYSGLAVASSVIFCHTKASVMWLFENMKARGHQVDVLHGDMTVVERADTIIRFKRGDFKVLITTNVFARGIDVAQVSVVINYDLPIKYNENDAPMVIDGFTQPDCETYLHRIGRTGRFGKTGIAINFIDSEDSMNMINVLENHFQMKIARMDPSNLVELEAIEMA